MNGIQRGRMLLFACLFMGTFLHLQGQSLITATPDTSQRGQTFAMAITGTGTSFTTATGAFIRTTPTPLWSTSWNASSNTNAVANFTIPSNATGGDFNLEVLGATPLVNGHHIRIPAIQSISHDTVRKGQSFTLTVNGYGTDFASASGISLTGPNTINGSNYSIIGLNQATDDFFIGGNRPGGSYNVAVVGQVSGSGLIYIRPSSISSISPDSAGLTQSVNVVINGHDSYWTPGIAVFLSGPGGSIAASSVTVNTPTNMVATFSIPANPNNIGTWTVAVSTGETFPGFEVLPGGGGTNYGRIEGRVYNDQNTNCTFDGTDSGISGRVISIQPGPYYASSDVSGNFGVWVPIGNYSVSTSVQLPDTFVCPQSGTITGVNVAAAGAVYSGNDFAVEGPTFSDYYISFPSLPIRPGFTRTIPLFINNYGQSNANNVTVKFKLPSFVNFISASPSSATVSGDTVIWNVNNVANFSANITFVTPASTPLGTQYTLEGWVTPDNIDVNLNNNYQAHTAIVVGSYDPNDKQVFHPDGSNADGFIEPTDSVLRYMIRFQNTGTDTAFNIYVRDTLDPLLDIGSFRMLQSSHNYIFNVGPNGEAEWTFANILLPDSGANQKGSNGLLIYEMDVSPSATVGDTISNRCGIYFDFNLPIITNTVNSILCPSYTVAWAHSPPAFGQVNFTDLTTGATSWLWDFGDGDSATTQNPSHFYAAPGVYNVCLYTENICGLPDTLCQLVSVLATTDAPTLRGWDLYPSPNSGEFIVELNWLAPMSVEFELYNSLGEQLASKQVAFVSDTQMVHFDIRDQPAGIYILRLEINGEQHFRKILKQ